MQITDMNKEHSIFPLWRQAFRPFFLFGSAFGMIAMALWLSLLNGQLYFSPLASPLFWHSHEMIFGFVSAFVVGFLLTAVQNWTGLRAVHGVPLILLFSQWSAARLLMATSIGPHWLIALIDISFYITAATLIAILVLKANNKRNLFFVPVLLLLGGFNLWSHIGAMSNNANIMHQGLYAGVMLVTLLMTVVGGRVLPMFTANGTNTAKVLPLKVLEISCVASAALFVAIFIFNLYQTLPPVLLGILFASASICHSVRALRWRPWVTFRAPLVWSLHLAYWFIPLGYGLFALHYFGFNVNLSSCIHALTAGAMSSLILAMIARVTLGHTGRALNIHVSMLFAFAFIIAAGFGRVLLGFFPHIPLNIGYLIAGVPWILAYLLYLVNYSTVLMKPRADGRPG